MSWLFRKHRYDYLNASNGDQSGLTTLFSPFSFEILFIASKSSSDKVNTLRFVLILSGLTDLGNTT